MKQGIFLNKALANFKDFVLAQGDQYCCIMKKCVFIIVNLTLKITLQVYTIHGIYWANLPY